MRKRNADWVPEVAVLARENAAIPMSSLPGAKISLLTTAELTDKRK
jgi:hypothetical protein